MSKEEIHVLMTGPQAPAYSDALERYYTLHRLWLADDRSRFLEGIAPVIRAIATNAPVGASTELIAALPKLEIISSFGVGLDRIDLEAAKARGVIVCTTQGVLNDCVADAGVALMLALARRVCEADRFVRLGQWLKGKFPLGTSLGGKTCGIMGMGNIGQAVARRAAAFGMEIAYFGRVPKAVLDYKYYADPLELARIADFLLLTLPGGPQTFHIVNAPLLQSLGPQGYVINVSRGSVIDHVALIAALKSGVIAGAALDVFEDEPKVPEELMSMNNVVLTPHIASGTNETHRAMGELAFSNLHAHFTGSRVLTRVV